jgi:hypothetical protein
LSIYFQEVNNRIWKPGRDVTVNEFICCFIGRAFEVITVPNKPTPTRIKIWNIRQQGFFSRWIWHKPDNKFGPVGIKTPEALKGILSGKEGNKTQAIVLYLFKQLPHTRYYVYLNNLFTLYKLMKVLRACGFGATSTCQTNLGVISELVNIKKNDKSINKLL